MKTKTVYLLFLSTGTLLAKTIDLYTKQSLNHVSIALDQELNLVYSFGRKRPHNPFIGGFIRENLSLPFFNRSMCAIYQLKVTEEEYTQLVEQIMIMESHKHLYRYNFLGLFGVMLNKEFHRENAFFCSQFVASMLQECGIYHSAKPPGLIRPQDLRAWRELTPFYYGKLKDYPYLTAHVEQEQRKSWRRSFFRLS
ncbi:hypothetical protein [Amphibacillus jilinensis]|uniref:hypothetical protein n=1 Tax=Amphibacillus jilinensis TaxID=1216008 RepID=UPI000305DD0A|nr:hypothetical protein [Amphibacillus jilinensis]